MRMLNLLLKKLKLITRNRKIKGYKSISNDKLLSILEAWEPVKEKEIIKNMRKKKSNIDKILKDIRKRFEPELIEKTIKDISKKI